MGAVNTHSKLSPSSASRWINCPGSIKLIAQCPESETSVHAAEGTVAHDLGEQRVTNKITKAQLIDKIGETVTVTHQITSDEKKKSVIKAIIFLAMGGLLCCFALFLGWLAFDGYYIPKLCKKSKQWIFRHKINANKFMEM